MDVLESLDVQLNDSRGFTNQETGWTFDQSTSQAFYMFESIEIMGEVIVGDGCPAQECGFGGSGCACCENFNSCDVISSHYIITIAVFVNQIEKFSFAGFYCSFQVSTIAQILMVFRGQK